MPLDGKRMIMGGFEPILCMLSGCVSSLDRLFYDVQDEYDLSGNLPETRR